MATYRRVYDSRHLQAWLQRTGISSGILRSVIEYGLPFLHSYGLSSTYRQANNSIREHCYYIDAEIQRLPLQSIAINE